jgi:RimJ/RimL family protein N-acetyltransferase
MPLSAPPWIDAPRVGLRLLERSDLTALMRMNGDPEVTRFLPYATWADERDAEAWFTRMQAVQAGGSAWQFVVVDRALGEAVGTCLLFRWDEGSARAELGYALARSHWGRGVMREALGALIGCAFGPMALRRLEAEVDPRNAASCRLLLGLGFATEGLRRERWLNHGQPVDVLGFGLLAREWRGG